MNLSSEMSARIATMVVKSFKDYKYYQQTYDTCKAKQIGKGAFGTVYKVAIKGEADSFAVKVVEIGYVEDYSDDSVSYTSETDSKCILEFVQCCQEAVLQSDEFKHPNIVEVHDKWIQNGSTNSEQAAISADDMLTIVGFLESSSAGGNNRLEITTEVREALLKVKGLCIYMAMELYDKSLKTWLEEGRKEPGAAEEIVRQVVGALSHIHSKNYSHCDLHPGNVLIKENVGTQRLEAAITDCGLTQLLTQSTASEVGSKRRGLAPYNLAPDTHLTDRFDMWSLGFIIYSILRPCAPTVTELDKLCKLATESGEKAAAFVIEHIKIDGEDDHMRSNVLRCLDRVVNTRVSSTVLDADLASF